ncbi:SLAP domain-containing protein [Companilactobacillus sp. HBUAS59544]|uniref:SLAP domain-containing protein n=1 Tax=Companilactobacillus sp. HBUAS59544 TaxID=3109363 RepID=UPI002FF108DA
MKKMRTVILTSILLSATVLGSNVSLIDAASKESTPIKVTNELTKQADALDVESTLDDTEQNSEKFIAKHKISEYKDDDTIEVVPVYMFEFPFYDDDGYAQALQDRLGIVDDEGNPLKLEITKTDEHTGFAEEISYSDTNEKGENITKHFKLKYIYESPYIYSTIDNPLYFKSSDLPSNFQYIIEDGNKGSNLDTDESNISSHSGNKTDLNNHEATVTTTIASEVPEDIADKGGVIEFTAKDNLYEVPASTLKREVVISKEPDWSQLESYQIQKGDKRVLNKDDNISVISDSNGNDYQVTINDLKDLDVNKPGQYDLEYKATLYNLPYSIVEEYGTNKPITYTKTMPVTVVDNKSEISYNLILVDKKTGNTIATQSGSAPDGTKVDIDSKLPAGYTLTDAQKTFTVDAKNPTKVVTVAKEVPYTINFIDKDTGESVDELTGTGKEGESMLLTAPEGYTLNNSADMIYTFDSASPTKEISVTKDSILDQDMNYTIKYEDVDTGKVIDEETGTGKLGDYVAAEAPEGYAFDKLTSYGFVLLKDDMAFTSYVKKSDVTYTITYIDQDTNKEVGTQTGSGINGDEVTLKTPAGYTFVNANDATYQVDKDSPNIKVFVKQSTLTEDNLITTHPYGGYVEIYDENGKLNKDVVLSQNTDWATDQKKTIDGVDYYRVATNQYVKADSVYVYSPLTGVVTTSKVTPVYNSKGQLVLDRALDKDAPWYSDRISKIKGEKMYRVATDEWVKASDVTLN